MLSKRFMETHLDHRMSLLLTATVLMFRGAVKDLNPKFVDAPLNSLICDRLATEPVSRLLKVTISNFMFHFSAHALHRSNKMMHFAGMLFHLASNLLQLSRKSFQSALAA